MNELGLDQYWEAFRENSYTEPRDLADIKYLPADSISSIFGIVKEAHLKKLKMATSVLSYPTKGFILFSDLWITHFEFTIVLILNIIESLKCLITICFMLLCFINSLLYASLLYKFFAL